MGGGQGRGQGWGGARRHSPSPSRHLAPHAPTAAVGRRAAPPRAAARRRPRQACAAPMTVWIVGWWRRAVPAAAYLPSLSSCGESSCACPPEPAGQGPSQASSRTALVGEGWKRREESSGGVMRTARRWSGAVGSQHSTVSSSLRHRAPPRWRWRAPSLAESSARQPQLGGQTSGRPGQHQRWAEARRGSRSFASRGSAARGAKARCPSEQRWSAPRSRQRPAPPPPTSARAHALRRLPERASKSW